MAQPPGGKETGTMASVGAGRGGPLNRLLPPNPASRHSRPPATLSETPASRPSLEDEENEMIPAQSPVDTGAEKEAQKVLIETPAIRKRRNSPRISHIHFSNRDISPVFRAAPASAFLIATPAIRIRRNPRRISHLNFPNRHKTRVRPLRLIQCPIPATLRACVRPAGLATNHSPLATSLLIGPPVIRIHPKSFRISTDSQSNRHKTHTLRLVFHPVGSSHSPLTTRHCIPNRNTSPFTFPANSLKTKANSISNRNRNRTSAQIPATLPPRPQSKPSVLTQPLVKLRHSLLILLLLFAAPRLRAQEPHHHDEPAATTANLKLGHVTFPISCAPGLQPAFERGVALLHSFWYDAAENQFREIAEKDPACAIAYWGEAFSLYRQLWFRPDEPVLKRGLALIHQAEAANAKTQRERDYIAALAVFYSDYTTKDNPTRAAAFSRAMETLYLRYPGDHEAAVFYALSLLSGGPEDDPDLAYPKKAVAILNAVLEKEPDHPGVAHYLIHACDNPQMAALGLAAARHYAAIAPASPHALHMPGHIFARLGLWQEDIQSNLASVAAVEHPAGPHLGAEHSLHAMDFLEYAYLQIGDDSKAEAIVAKAMAVRPDEMDPGFGGFLGYVHAHFPAVFALETRDWKSAEALVAPAAADPGNQAITYWARAVAAGHLRDVPAARDAVAQYDAMVDAVKKGPHAFVAKGMSTARDEARAWLAFAERKPDDAVALLRPLAEKQDRDGKGEVEAPAREMLAEILLETGHAQDALAEYEKSLKSDPGRFNGLYGAARAAEQSGEREKAAGYYSKLLKNCEGVANSDRPELARARSLIARNSVGN